MSFPRVSVMLTFRCWHDNPAKYPRILRFWVGVRRPMISVFHCPYLLEIDFLWLRVSWGA